jgi:hypothetical protein
VVRRISIGIALACSVVLTYRIVSSATHLEVSQSMPLSTYQGFFAQVCITIWGLWGHARGLDPMNHINAFGRFYVYFVSLACPLIGFGVFAAVSRQKIGWQWWRPLAIAVLFATPLQEMLHRGFRALGLGEPAAEPARTAVVLLFMIWSIGAIRISGRRPNKAIEGSVIA